MHGMNSVCFPPACFSYLSQFNRLRRRQTDIDRCRRFPPWCLYSCWLRWSEVEKGETREAMTCTTRQTERGITTRDRMLFFSCGMPTMLVSKSSEVMYWGFSVLSRSRMSCQGFCRYTLCHFCSLYWTAKWQRTKSSAAGHMNTLRARKKGVWRWSGW